MTMKWYESKTNKTAVVAIIGAALGAWTKTIDPVTAVQTIVMSLMAIFMRQGIAKSQQ